MNTHELYGPSTQIAVTLAGLTDTSKRQATAVQNDTLGHCDALVGGKIKTGTGSGAGDYIDVYAAASVDDGVTFSGDCSGSDAAYADVAENLVFLGRIATATQSTSYEFGPWSIAAAFGGVLPKRWTLVFDNESDSTLSATAADHAVYYQGVGYGQ